MMKPSGQFLYEDEYHAFYDVSWTTIGSVIDITTQTFQPYVWGDTPTGYIQNGILFKLGIITIHRQVLRPLENGYEIVAEGASQIIDYVQMNFPCQAGPIDPFAFHLNNIVSDSVEAIITEGPRWADPDSPDDSEAIWGDLESSGDPATDITVTGGADNFEFIDVWSN